MDNTIIPIPVEQLKEHKENKKYFSDITGSDYELLVQSIRTQGVLTPLLIAQDAEGSYTVLSGHQRLRAARDLGIANVPCLIIETADNSEQVDILTQANLGRSITLAERYKIGERLLEREQSEQGKRSDLEKENATSGHNAQKLAKRDRVAQQAGLTDHDIKTLYKIKNMPLAEQQEFWVWLQSTNPNKKTIAEKLKNALKQNRQYKESDKELNQLKRKAKLARELQEAAEQIRSPKDYREGQALQALRKELEAIRVTSSEALGRLQAVQVPASQLVHNWVTQEAAEIAGLLRQQAQQIAQHFGIAPEQPPAPQPASYPNSSSSSSIQQGAEREIQKQAEALANDFFDGEDTDWDI